ncbi:MAG TPA: hypothetical protein VKX46_05130 [Ktedonobacteraceae bacterium]|nr:hypothetical protein [Ktedonobacteraceae bacterium]
MSEQVKTNEQIYPAMRVRFVPFTLAQNERQAVIGRNHNSDYLEFEAIGGEIISRLDAGKTIAEVQREVEALAATDVDVASFVEDLQALGYVTLLDPEEIHPGSARVSLASRSRINSICWRGFLALSSLALLFTIVTLFRQPSLLPPASALILPATPLIGALLALLLVDSIVTAFHEGAHVLVGRWHGLSPRIKMGRRGLWFVIETDLTGVWQLEKRWRWQPIVAGLMSDMTLAALALLVTQHTEPYTFPHDVAHMALLLILAKMLWQCQWYLRTDLYFLFAALGDIGDLSQLAWQRLRQRTAAGQSATDAGRLASRLYLFSLPIALCATGVLLLWFVLPALLAAFHSLTSIGLF